jgi:hypothetical protein
VGAGVMMELIQTQEQAGVLADAIVGLLRRAAVGQGGPTPPPVEGKKRKSSLVLNESAGDGMLILPPEGQPLAYLTASISKMPPTLVDKVNP